LVQSINKFFFLRLRYRLGADWFAIARYL